MLLTRAGPGDLEADTEVKVCNGTRWQRPDRGTCGVSRVHHVSGVRAVRTDGDGNVGLRGNVLEKPFGPRVHAAHEGNGVFPLHVVHDVEVAHFIAGGGPADKSPDRDRDDARRASSAG